MNQSSNHSANPYASPQIVGTQSPTYSRWRRIFVAALLASLPCLATWTFLEFGGDIVSASSAVEPDNAVKTPNPRPAPRGFVGNTQLIMVWVNPRLAAFAGRWTYFVYSCVPIWGFVAPEIFRVRRHGGAISRCISRIGLVTPSLVLGVMLAWPWLAVILFGRWLEG